MTTLSEQDVRDLLLGAAIVGTGGGGSLEDGLLLMEEIFQEGGEVLLAELDEIPEDALIGSPYSCGAIGVLDEAQQRAFNALPKIDTTREILSLRALEEYFGKSFYGIFATELGGGNTAVALHAAAKMGIPIIDADPAGRSVPCLQHSTLFLNDIPITPMGLASDFGDSMVLTKVANDDRAEAIARALAVASFNSIGVTDHPAPWHVLKHALIPNTLNYCLNIGRLARQSQEEGRIFARDIADTFDGYFLFEGKITEASWEDRDGFTFGEILIAGHKDYHGEELKLWFQNEYILSWKNGEAFVTVPDSINVVRHDHNMPLLNPEAEVGMEVSVFALRAFDEWRTKEALEIFSPSFFGFDIDYRPVEEILK